MKTMMYVSRLGEEIATSLRMSAPISPECSAMPTPIIATRITPTAAKPRKFGTNEVNMNRTPSPVSRPLASTRSDSILYSPRSTSGS